MMSPWKWGFYKVFVKSLLEECLHKIMPDTELFLKNIHYFYLLNPLATFVNFLIFKYNKLEIEEEGVLLEQESLKYVIITPFQTNQAV